MGRSLARGAGCAATWLGVSREQFTVGCGGKDRWGGEHGVQAACAADAERVYLGWTGNEVGRALIAVDPKDNGKPVQDVLWSQVGGFASVHRLAVDAGVVYFVSETTMAAVDAKTGRPVGGPALHKKLSAIWPDAAGKPVRLNPIEDGFCAVAGKLYLTFSGNNLVAQMDAKTGLVTRTYTVKLPGSIAAGHGGGLYVCSESSKVLALNPITGLTRVVVTGLVNTDGLAVDKRGNLCLTFGFPKPHVAVYSPQGKRLVQMGKARRGAVGSRQLGAFITDRRGSGRPDLGGGGNAPATSQCVGSEAGQVRARIFWANALRRQWGSDSPARPQHYDG